MKVRVDVDTLSQEDSGNITGGIWLSDGAWCFPEEGWNDLPVIILSWWVEALNTLSEAAEPAECFFMDGQWAFRVSPVSSGDWLVQFLGAANDEAIRVIHVEPLAFRRSLYDAARSVVRKCQLLSLHSEEVTRLAQLTLTAA